MRVQIVILSCLLSVVILQFYLIGIFSITNGFDKNVRQIYMYLFTEIYNFTYDDFLDSSQEKGLHILVGHNDLLVEGILELVQQIQTVQ